MCTRRPHANTPVKGSGASRVCAEGWGGFSTTTISASLTHVCVCVWRAGVSCYPRIRRQPINYKLMKGDDCSMNTRIVGLLSDSPGALRACLCDACVFVCERAKCVDDAFSTSARSPSPPPARQFCTSAAHARREPTFLVVSVGDEVVRGCAVEALRAMQTRLGRTNIYIPCVCRRTGLCVQLFVSGHLYYNHTIENWPGGDLS